MKYFYFLFSLLVSLNLFGDIEIRDSDVYSYTQQELLQIFQDNHIDPYHITNQEDNILHTLSKKGHVNAIKLALALGIDPLMPNRAGDLPIHTATSKNNKEIVLLLIENGASVTTPNKKNQTPYHIALKNGYTELIDLFLSLGYQPHENPLIDEMIAEGYPLELKDGKGQNALHKAVIEGRLELIPKFIESGLSIDSQTNNGQTALMLAAQKGKLDAVKLLLEMGADAAIKDSKNYTALFYTVIKDYYYIAKILLEHDYTHVNDLNGKGIGVIHYAAARGNPLMISLLLKFEANPSLCTVSEYWSEADTWTPDDRAAAAEFADPAYALGGYLKPRATPLAIVSELYPAREDLKALFIDYAGEFFYKSSIKGVSLQNYLKN